jgi:hypothetical protein
VISSPASARSSPNPVCERARRYFINLYAKMSYGISSLTARPLPGSRSTPLLWVL